MKTGELIAALAAGAGAVEPNAVARRYASALGWGAFGATLAMAIALGVRPDLHQASHLPMFWIKLAFPAALFAAALTAATRLARPGMRLGHVPAVLVVLLAAVWAMGLIDLVAAQPYEREALIFGNTWRECPFAIALLSIPAFVAAFWAMRGLAPTRLALAGAASGLVAGALGALIYALHCDETGAPFFGIWYVAGMLIPTGVGALLGPRMLRW